MEKTILGIIREGKEPPDRRVPLTPIHCRQLQEAYPILEVLVQTSPIRGYSDDEYRAEGITVQEDMSSCDILMGVKEVPIEQLIAGKKYFFFSHTIKEQPYNKKLLQTVLQGNIQNAQLFMMQFQSVIEQVLTRGDVWGFLRRAMYLRYEIDIGMPRAPLGVSLNEWKDQEIHVLIDRVFDVIATD